MIDACHQTLLQKFAWLDSFSSWPDTPARVERHWRVGGPVRFDPPRAASVLFGLFLSQATITADAAEWRRGRLHRQHLITLLIRLERTPIPILEATGPFTSIVTAGRPDGFTPQNQSASPVAFWYRPSPRQPADIGSACLPNRRSELLKQPGPALGGVSIGPGSLRRLHCVSNATDTD